MILSLIAIAQMVGADDVCVPGFAVTPKVQHEVPNGISYFIRSSPATREISFGSIDEKTPSQLLNVDTGRMSQLDGSVDPVLTPDGALLTIPQGVIYDGEEKKTRIVPKSEELKPKYAYFNGQILECENDTCEKVSKLSKEDLIKTGQDYVYSAMTFYARDSSGGFKFIHADDDQNMNYQSLGSLDNTGDQKRYRMLFKQDQIAFQDYAYDPVRKKIEMLGSRHAVCAEAAGGDMPMLSKDGRSLSAYDEADHAVRVYQLTDQGKCQVQDRLPSMTGKVDFSPNGKLLAFALDSAAAPGETGSREYERPNADQRLRAYVYDRETKRLTQIDSEISGQTYFPVFLSDHEIGYIHAPETAEGNRMQIKVVDIGRKDLIPTKCPACRAIPKIRQASAMLAMLYSKRCNPLDFDFSDADRVLGWLTPQTCERFVKSITSSTLDEAKMVVSPVNLDPKTPRKWKTDLIKKLSLADLKKVCGRLVVPVAADSEVRSAH